MAQDDEQEIDLDALQAQINMAMAEEEALVSSWIKPSKTPSKGSKRTFEEMEKELQDYMRRPPRLGVGAPIPDQVGPTSQEEARLKYKLVGNDKKRKREEESEKKLDNDDEEEEESKKGESSSGTKVTRVDPFNLPKKKVKRKDDAGKQGLNGVKPAPVVVGTSSSTRSREASPRTSTVDRAESKPTGDASDRSVPLVNGTSVSAPSAPAIEAIPLNLTLKPSEPKRSEEIKKATASPSEESSPLTSPVSDCQPTLHPVFDNPRAIHQTDGFVSKGIAPVSRAIPLSDAGSSPIQTPAHSQSLVTPVSPSSQSTFGHQLSKSARRKKNRKRRKKHALEQSIAGTSNSNVAGLNGVAKYESDAFTAMSTISRSDAGTSIDHRRPDLLINGISVEGRDVDGRGKEKGTRPANSTPKGTDNGANRLNERVGGNVPTEPPSKHDGTPIPTASSPLSPSRPPGGLPLLNLAGLPVPDIDNSDATQSPTSPSKKRRKRRKRNKNKGAKADSTGTVN